MLSGTPKGKNGGVFMSRYSNLMKHKIQQKKSYMNRLCDKDYGGSMKMMEDDRKNGEPDWRGHPRRNKGFEYWKTFYLSGCRRFAKSATNRIIRARYRELLRNADPEDVQALRGADYEKMFDYLWTVW